MTLNDILLVLKKDNFNDEQFLSFVIDSLESLNKKDTRSFVEALFSSDFESKHKMNPYVLNLIVKKYPLSFEDKRHDSRFRIDKGFGPNKTKSYRCSIFSMYGQFVFACSLFRDHLSRWTISPRSNIYNHGINIIEADHFIDLKEMVLLDLETTGLNPLTGDVVEIALFDPSSKKEYSRLLPLIRSEHIVPEIAELTGIDDKMVNGMPSITSNELDELIDEFNLSNKPLLIWSGINMFDANFLATLFIQNGNKRFKELKFVSAMDIIKRFSGYTFSSLSKDYLADYLNIDASGSHRALNDCKIEANIYQYLYEHRK